MRPYYLDTSALVKRYVAEVGVTWVRSLFEPSLGNMFFLASIGPVELASALSLKGRRGEITAMVRDSRLLAFQASTSDFALIHVDAVVPHAVHLVTTHGLRAYDAVHLAAALQAVQNLEPSLASGFTFLSADTKLLAAAAAEGLTTDDPNQH